MFDEVTRRARSRALLTDTLPYEVPVIFSNDKLYAALMQKPDAARRAEQSIVQKICSYGYSVTRPYTYSIVKDGKRFTSLGIVHPVTQIRMAAFYEGFSQPILSSCGRSNFSLRRPRAETPLFSEAELSGQETFRLGIPHSDPAQGELDVSHFVSYFSYHKYNLLGKFVESEEFKRLEKRFKYLATLDVSKCFFNIYTHSIGWAVKGKEFSKENKGAFSFESRFDELMQSSNYGETNGIVVGPEMSRIFAEIIFQDIDVTVERQLEPLQNNRDYAVRRYVDDFFVFANSRETADIIVEKLRSGLEQYKLFANESKTKLDTRPFVSAISLARTDVSVIISDIYALADEITAAGDAITVAAKARAVKARTSEIRQACGRHNVAIGVVSGWILANLKNVLVKIVNFARSCPVDSAASLYLALSSVLDVIFYICAVDLRVRTTYTLCQCLAVLKGLQGNTLPDLSDRIAHFLAEEMAILIRNASALGSEDGLGVEMANLLISGTHYLGKSFLRGEAAGEAIRRMAHDPNISYFRYITVKFCCIDDPRSSELVDAVNEKAIALVERQGDKVQLDAESYLVFCDLLSAPDLAIRTKARLYKARFGGNPSNAVLDRALQSIGFVDWAGVAIQHTLERKALRPVYTWS